MAGTAPLREPIVGKNGRLSPVWARYFTRSLDPASNKKLEQIFTLFEDGSIPYVSNNLLVEDNDRLFWDAVNNVLRITGIIQSQGRRMGTTDVNFSMSPYTVQLSDEIIWVDASLGNVQLLYPSAVDIKGQTYSIEKIDTTNNTVESLPDGFELINGDVSFTLYYEYESIKPTSTGVNWLI